MVKILGAVLAVLLPFAAAAADDPETVYGKLHRATLAGNVDEVLSYATAERRKEMASLPGREDMVRMMAMSLPKTYSVTKKGTTLKGSKAHLELRGIHESNGPTRATVELLKEQGEWRVDEWSWSNLVAQAPAETDKPSPAVPAKAPADQPATETVSTVPVDAPTLRKAAEVMPCVIKPVMSDDELRRCGATPPKYENQ